MKIRDFIIIFLMYAPIIMWNAFDVGMSQIAIDELQSSHAVMYQRQTYLKDITCGQCHWETIPEGWGRHLGGDE